MENPSPRFRRPAPQEQEILEQRCVRLIESQEQARFDALVIEHHYLKRAALVGKHLRYVARCLRLADATPRKNAWPAAIHKISAKK